VVPPCPSHITENQEFSSISNLILNQYKGSEIAIGERGGGADHENNIPYL